jgi:phosphoribosyl-AMP cyclohydrolase
MEFTNGTLEVPPMSPERAQSVNRPEADILDATPERTEEDLPFLSALRWTADQLVPAIVQDAENGEVLMMAWMDESALRRTVATGQTHFYSRSRRAAWHKGGTSGHVQEVVSIFIDCDADVVLIKARQVGGACHEGYRSCFFRRVGPEGQLEVVAQPVFEAAAVYGAHADGGAAAGSSQAGEPPLASRLGGNFPPRPGRA